MIQSAYAFAELSVDRLYPWVFWSTVSQMVGGGHGHEYGPPFSPLVSMPMILVITS